MKTGYKVGDAMTNSPITVSSDTSLRECCRVMSDKKVGSLMVMSGNKLKGMLTSDMILKAAADGYRLSTTAISELKFGSSPKIESRMDIHEALLKMSELDVRQLPVEESGKVIGLLTMKDVLKVEPALFELVVSNIKIREEDQKPLSSAYK